MAALFVLSFFALKYKELSLILFSAFFFRLIFAYINVFVTTLPDASNDAYFFELYAWELSLNGIGIALSSFPGFFESWFYSWLISIFYSLTDRSIFAVHIFSVLFSSLSIVLIWKICILLWDNRSSKVAAWIFALYPTIVLYGSIPLRETFFIFFLLLGVFFMIEKSRDDSNLDLVKSFASFLIAAQFHICAVIPIIILFFSIVYSTLFRKKNGFNLSKNSRYGQLFAIGGISLFCSLLIFMFFLEIFIPKFGSFLKVFDLQYYVEISQNKFIESNASYPVFLLPENAFQLIILFPVRVIYFLFSPFPWDISSLFHLVGLFDSLFFIFLFYRMSSMRLVSYSRSEVICLFLILIGLVIVFSIFTLNFGTGIRHRSKLLPLILIIVASKLKIFTLKK